MFGEIGSPFTLGVNYWPRRKAMFWWSRFDAGEVRDEFSLIRELGMSKVRIFLLWEDWQPMPDTVSLECMAHLEQVCDIAAGLGLGLDVTFFTGHMSGPNWAPAWMLDKSTPAPDNRWVATGGQYVPYGYRNYYTDPGVLAAQKLLLGTVVKAFKDHPGIWLWNLGNEPDLFAIAPDREIGKRWLREMQDTIRAHDPVKPITCGLHSASLFGTHAPRIDDTFGLMDVAVMHGYPMYTDVAKSPLDPHWLAFNCALTTALCGKPTLMEEFGGCTAPQAAPSQVWAWNSYGVDRTQFMASEEDFATFIRENLVNLQAAGALGAMVWCFADYTPDLWSKPPCNESLHERYFGLVRPDGSPKPHAEAIKAFAATQPKVQAPARPFAPRITPDEYYAAPSDQIRRLYDEYLRA